MTGFGAAMGVARAFRRTAGLSAWAVALMAVGIGTTTVVFSLVGAVFLQPLPYDDPHMLFSIDRGPLNYSVDGATVTYMRQGIESLESVAAMQRPIQVSVSSEGDVEYAFAMRVTASYFSVLRSSFAVGRDFASDDERVERTVILSHALAEGFDWTGADAIGRVLVLRGEPHQVVGVLSESFRGVPPADLWLPIAPRVGQGRNFRLLGRLSTDSSLAEARRELTVLETDLRRVHPDALRPVERLALTPLQNNLGTDVMPVLVILVLVAGLVLFLSCTNVGSLMVARAHVRRRELAVMAALGATNRHLVTRIMSENILIATLGGIAGLFFAAVLLRIVLSAAPVFAPWDVTFDTFTLLSTTATTVLTAFLFGIMPSLYARRLEVARVLAGTDTRAGVAMTVRTRRMLLAGQSAVAMVLVVVGLFLLRTLIDRTDGDLGFVPNPVLTSSMLPSGGSGNGEEVVGILRSVEEAVTNIDGVAFVGVSNVVPTGQTFNVPVAVRDQSGTLSTANVGWGYVAGDYFLALQAPLLMGRLPNRSDAGGAEKVALVNSAFVRALLGGREPSAVTLEVGSAQEQASSMSLIRIVGVIGDMRGDGLSTPRPTIFVPLAQADSWLLTAVHTRFPTHLVVRARNELNALAPQVEATVRQRQPNLPFTSPTRLVDTLSQVRSQLYAYALTAAGIAAVALLVVAGGIYSLMSFVTEQRRQEIGLRAALGATPVRVLSSLLVPTLSVAVIAIVAGAFLGFLTLRVVVALTLNETYDPTYDVYALGAALLFLVVLLVSLAPAWQLVRTGPAGALHPPA